MPLTTSPMNTHGSNNAYEIKYHPLVVNKDIQKISAENRFKIKTSIEKKLTAHPEIFGKPLRKSLKGYRKLRIGDYRVVFKIKGKIIFILLIEHRSIVYKEIIKRQ